MEPEPVVRDVVAAAFADARIESVSEVTRGNLKQVYEVCRATDGPHDRVHVSLHVESPPSGDPVEPHMTERVADLDIPTPEVIAFDAESAPTHLVTETVEGRNLMEVYPEMSAAERRRIVHRVGAYTGHLHAAFEGQMDAHGWLGLEEDSTLTTSPVQDSWQAFYREELQNQYQHLPVSLTWLRPVVEYHVDRHADLLTGPFTPVVSHGDLRPGNVIADDGEVAGVIDWQVPYACHAEFGITKVECMFIDKHVPDSAEQRMLRHELYDAYTEQYELPPAFEQRRPLYRLPWFLRLFAESTTEYHPDTAFDLYQLVLSKVARVLAGRDRLDHPAI